MFDFAKMNSMKSMAPTVPPYRPLTPMSIPEPVSRLLPMFSDFLPFPTSVSVSLSSGQNAAQEHESSKRLKQASYKLAAVGRLQD